MSIQLAEKISIRNIFCENKDACIRQILDESPEIVKGWLLSLFSLPFGNGKHS